MHWNACALLAIEIFIYESYTTRSQASTSSVNRIFLHLILIELCRYISALLCSQLSWQNSITSTPFNAVCATQNARSLDVRQLRRETNSDLTLLQKT